MTSPACGVSPAVVWNGCVPPAAPRNWEGRVVLLIVVGALLIVADSGTEALLAPSVAKDTVRVSGSENSLEVAIPDVVSGREGINLVLSVEKAEFFHADGTPSMAEVKPEEESVDRAASEVASGSCEVLSGGLLAVVDVGTEALLASSIAEDTVRVFGSEDCLEVVIPETVRNLVLSVEKAKCFHAGGTPSTAEVTLEDESLDEAARGSSEALSGTFSAAAVVGPVPS